MVKKIRINEGVETIGNDKAENIIDNFKYSGNWFKDFHRLWDKLDNFYMYDVGVYNDGIHNYIIDKVMEKMVYRYPEREQEIRDEFEGFIYH